MTMSRRFGIVQHYVLVGLGVLGCLLGLAGRETWAQDNEDTRATLRGVEGVLVFVEDLGDEVEHAGLTRQQIRTDVELRLRKAGIRILTEAERVGMPGAPWLSVNVIVYLHPDTRLAAFRIDVSLQQLAFLATDGSRALVSTWSVGKTGIAGRRRLFDLRNDVKDQVDVFINAYLRVHPRPIGGAAPPATPPRRTLAR
jgi:hypothetical protein